MFDDFGSYFYLFWDSLLGGVVFPVHDVFVMAIMRIFAYNPIAIWAVSLLGASLGHMISWFLGICTAYAEKAGFIPARHTRLQKFELFFSKYGSIVLLGSFIPNFGPFLSFICGFYELKWTKSLFAIVTVHGVYYYAELSGHL